jgi:hypothetical protein
VSTGKGDFQSALGLVLSFNILEIEVIEPFVAQATALDLLPAESRGPGRLFLFQLALQA